MSCVENKVALITGAARGIGFEFAMTLLRKKLKAVALIDINEEIGLRAIQDVEKEYGEGRAIFVKADVTVTKQFEEAFEKTVKAFGQLDIVINNAGILNEINWESAVAVNLVGCINGSTLAMQKYLPKYRSDDEGLIVNIASSVYITPIEQMPVYTATKHGVVAFSRCIAGPIHSSMFNVKVIVICPSATSTEMMGVSTAQNIPPFLANWKNFEGREAPLQTPRQLADNVYEILQDGDTTSGSVWLIENNTRRTIDCPTFNF